MEDGKSIFVEISASSGDAVSSLFGIENAGWPAIQTRHHYSIFHQDEEFTDFPVIGQLRRRNERLPHPDESPVDPRLLVQEAQAKLSGDEKVLAAIERIELTPLQVFNMPTELRVKAGAKVALTFRNLTQHAPQCDHCGTGSPTAIMDV